jgi:hypothetical protein
MTLQWALRMKALAMDLSKILTILEEYLDDHLVVVLRRSQRMNVYEHLVLILVVV